MEELNILIYMDNNLPETTIVSPALTQAAAPQPQSNRRLIIIGGILLVLVLASAGLYFFTKTKTAPPAVSPTPTPTPVSSQEAKFFLTADPPIASVGAKIKVTVFTKTDKDAANLFIAKLKFPNSLLQAKSISLRSEATSSGFIKDWFISNWVENTIDNNSGSVSLVGGVPNPGFQTQPESSGSAMADVIFEAKAAGDGVISFDDTSAIYRNSDNTNILATKQATNIKITSETVLAPSSIIATPSATPTQVLTQTPSPSPTATASPTPTVSSPSATPTGPLAGDVNSDGKLDLQDLSALLSAWGKTTNPKADLNNDGVVNAFDYSMLTKLLKDAKIIQ